MSYTYLQEQGEESSVECFLDIPAYVLSRSKNTHERFCSNGSETGSCQDSLSGMISEPSMERHGEEGLMSSAGGSHVRTYQQQERAPGSKESEADYGEKWQELSVKYSRDSSSWKTHLCLWEEDLPWSSVTLPKWGMMRDGVCWEQTTPELPTSESESGLWATPSARDWKDTPGMSTTGTNPDGSERTRLDQLARQVYHKEQFPTPVADDTGHRKRRYAQGGTPLSHKAGGSLNPTWVEWLMGWPLRWTDLKPLEMDRFRMWRTRMEYPNYRAMTRKTFFTTATSTLLTWVTGICQNVNAAISRWSWPGYPGKAALRRHIDRSPNHRVSGKPPKSATFDELVRWHDLDHGVRRGDPPRWKSARWVPGTDKKISREMTVSLDTGQTLRERLGQ